MRRIQGVLNWPRSTAAQLATTHVRLRWNWVLPEYRFVRRYLERTPQAPLSLKQVDPLIRELTQYRDLIQQRTQLRGTQTMNLIELNHSLRNCA